MIHEIAKRLEARIRDQGVPYRVITGPERAPSRASRIVLERDRDSGDSFGPTRSQHGNPKSPATRSVGCLLRIYAQSTHAGATAYEHERLAELVLDRVMVALDQVCRGERRAGWEPRTGRFVAPEDLKDTEQWPGALYEFKFTTDRAVLDMTWPTAAFPEGSARPEGSYDSVGNEMNVAVKGGDEESFPFGATA